MKIVHVQQFFNEGYGYQENLLPYYQMQSGHDVVMLTSNYSDGFNGANRKHKAEELIENGFKVKRLNVRFELNQKFVCFNNLYQAIEAEKPDYIFHHSIAAPSIRIVSQYKRAHPHVFLALDNHIDLTIANQNRLIKNIYYNFIWKAVLKHFDPFIDAYFGVTPSRCLFLENELGIASQKIRFLPIGADVDHCQVSMTKQDLFERFHLDPTAFTFIHGGKMTPHKQGNKLLEAFMQIPDQKIQLVLFGSIEDPEILRLSSQDTRIKHIGWLNRQDTLALLASSDAGIWNSQHTTLLEDCVAAGLPLILRYYGSTSHLIEKSGVFLYRGTVKEIKDAMSMLVDHKDLLESLRIEAHKLTDLLSYHAVARESVAYAKDFAPQLIHQKFMTFSDSDFDYQTFSCIR